MHRVHYAGGSVLTGDAIAAALLDYASALARRASSATVDIPVREEDGSQGIAQVLIGPASQFVTTHEPGPGDEILDDELVERFTAATRTLDSSAARPLDDGQSTVPPVDYDVPN
jgi:hypothetical protein